MVTVRLTQAQAERLDRLIYEAALSAGQAEEQAALSELLQVMAESGSEAHTLLKCGHCGQWFRASKQGQAAKYCSVKCKQAAYRERKKAWKKVIRR